MLTIKSIILIVVILTLLHSLGVFVPYSYPLQVSTVKLQVQKYRNDIEVNYRYCLSLLKAMEVYPGDDFKYHLQHRFQALERLNRLLEDSKKFDDEYNLRELDTRMMKMYMEPCFSEKNMHLSCFFTKAHEMQVAN